MNVLIIGLGSIAQKHVDVLKKINSSSCIYALRSSANSSAIKGVTNVYSIEDCKNIDFIIISNPTAFHADAIKQVACLKKPLFIEKPPFHNLHDAEECLFLTKKNALTTYTAFNLRFLDCLVYLKQNVDIHKVQEVNVYCGSYLPSWRPNTDYKKNYSSSAAMGGGVHLDLIHELDYVLWIFGKPAEVKKVLRSKSKLNIDATDYANYILIYDTFVVNIVLNYYRKDTKRTCEVVLETETWNVDLIENKINELTSQRVLFESKQKVIDTYPLQMEYFFESVLKNKNSFNSLKESVETLKIALL